MQAHRDAIDRGDDGYIDPVTGAFVFTAAYLAGPRLLQLRLPPLPLGRGRSYDDSRTTGARTGSRCNAALAERRPCVASR